jgi:hypothetical protein
MTKRKKTRPAKAVERVRIEKAHGLRSRNCRPRWVSGELPMENSRDPKDIMSATDFDVDVGVDGVVETCEIEVEEGFLTALEFLDRGVEAWLSGRRSTLAVGATICDRNCSD